MKPRDLPDVIETDRLTLRPQQPADAAVFRQLWTERDTRIPAHRQIDAEGRPAVEDIAEQIRAASGPRPMTLERKDTGDVIGYCGLVFGGNGPADEPEIGFELLRSQHRQGYATEAGGAIVHSAAAAGYRRLWATVWEWNTASRRVLDKLGFREHSRDHSRPQHGTNVLYVLDLSEEEQL